MTTGVSTNMKRLSVVVALAAIVGAIWYLSQSSSAAKVPTNDPPPPAAKASPGSGTTATASQRPVDKVTKLTPEERKAMAERIRRAQSSRSDSRGAISAPAAPKLPDEVTAEEPKITKTALKAAMREVIPMLAECYDAARPTLEGSRLELVAEITLSGDPDIGTIIDTKALADNAGKALPAKFDDCLRTTFMTLALPPLTEGDKIEVRYPFVFSHDPE